MFDGTQSYIRSILCTSILDELKKEYASLYPSIKSDNIDVSITIQKYLSVTIESVKFNARANLIVYVTDPASLKPRPVRIHYFIYHSFHYNNAPFQHAFAVVTWLKKHHDKDHLRKPLEIWWKKIS